MPKKFLWGVLFLSIFLNQNTLSMDKYELECKLREALENNRLDLVKDLIENKGVDPNNERERPIFAAVRSGNFDTVKCLVKHGGNPDKKDRTGGSPLRYSVWWYEKNLFPVLKYLVVQGAEIKKNMLGRASKMTIGYLQKVRAFRKLKSDEKINLVTELLENWKDLKIYAPVFFYDAIIELINNINQMGISEESFESGSKNLLINKLYDLMESETGGQKFKEMVQARILKYFDLCLDYQEKEGNKRVLSVLEALGSVDKSILAQKAAKAYISLKNYLGDVQERVAFVNGRDDIARKKIVLNNKTVAMPLFCGN